MRILYNSSYILVTQVDQLQLNPENLQTLKKILHFSSQTTSHGYILWIIFNLRNTVLTICTLYLPYQQAAVSLGSAEYFIILLGSKQTSDKPEHQSHLPKPRSNGSALCDQGFSSTSINVRRKSKRPMCSKVDMLPVLRESPRTPSLHTPLPFHPFLVDTFPPPLHPQSLPLPPLCLPPLPSHCYPPLPLRCHPNKKGGKKGYVSQASKRARELSQPPGLVCSGIVPSPLHHCPPPLHPPQTPRCRQRTWTWHHLHPWTKRSRRDLHLLRPS